MNVQRFQRFRYLVRNWTRDNSALIILCGLPLAVVVLLAFPIGAQAQSFMAQGTWITSDGQLTGNWNATFLAAGSDVSGTIALTGLPGLAGGAVAGSMGAGSIDFGVIYNAQEAATFQGTIASAALAGTFATSDGHTGNWQGQIVSTPATPTPVSAPTDAGPTSTPTQTDPGTP